MNTYHVHRSDVFFLADTSEVIVHLSDFAFADLKPKAAVISLGAVDTPMQLRGMGNQQGKLVVCLVPDDRDSFARLLDALPDEEMTLSALDVDLPLRG